MPGLFFWRAGLRCFYRGFGRNNLSAGGRRFWGGGLVGSDGDRCDRSRRALLLG
jgi:hypothetical protein